MDCAGPGRAVAAGFAAQDVGAHGQGPQNAGGREERRHPLRGRLQVGPPSPPDVAFPCIPDCYIAPTLYPDPWCAALRASTQAQGQKDLSFSSDIAGALAIL